MLSFLFLFPSIIIIWNYVFKDFFLKVIKQGETFWKYSENSFFFRVFLFLWFLIFILLRLIWLHFAFVLRVLNFIFVFLILNYNNIVWPIIVKLFLFLDSLVNFNKINFIALVKTNIAVAHQIYFHLITIEILWQTYIKIFTCISFKCNSLHRN